MSNNISSSDTGFVLPFSVIIPAVVLLALISGIYIYEHVGAKTTIAPAAATQPAVDPALAARLAAAKAVVESQTALLDRMLVESQVQGRYGTIYVDASGKVDTASDKIAASFQAAQAVAATAAGKTAVLAITATIQQITDTLASWKASLAQYDDSKVTLPVLAAAGSKDTNDLKADIKQLQDIVDGLTPDNSGLTPDQIAAYKAAVDDAQKQVDQVVDSIAPFVDQGGGGTGGGTGGTGSDSGDTSGGAGNTGGTGGSGPTQQDINAQQIIVDQAKANADAIQAQIDAGSGGTDGSNGSGGTGGSNGDQGDIPQGTGGDFVPPPDQNQQDQSGLPQLIEGANKY